MDKSAIEERVKELKSISGTHSPSISTLLEEIPEIKIKIDACFLSNPYATDLFMEFFDRELVKQNKLREILEFYPPQNYDISLFVSKAISVPHENIFVTNGAIEAIQAIIQKFVKKKICIILPTFSSYYEFVREDCEVFYYQLQKDENYQLDIFDYIEFVKKNQIDTVVIINPNNPNGSYLNGKDLAHIFEELKHIENLIIDESFIHFAYENLELSQISSEQLIGKYKNLILIKSMSKDFGIAGIRAGYAIMSAEKVKKLLSNGYLWNVSGLAGYFFKIYSKEDFINAYDICRKKYIMNTLMFISEIANIPNVKVYTSKANFVLIEFLDGRTSFDISLELLLDYGIYVRDCSDKKGLKGQFIRVASRTFEENLEIIKALKHIAHKSMVLG